MQPVRGLALIAVVFALGYLFSRLFAADITTSDEKSSGPGQGECGYQLVVNDRTLGTVFLTEPGNLETILDHLKEKGLRVVDPGSVFPCGSVIYLRDGNVQDVQRLSGEQIIACGKRIALNEATEDDLQSVPGIGPSIARRICEKRKVLGRFESVSELSKTPGIGPKKAQEFEKYLRKD